MPLSSFSQENWFVRVVYYCCLNMFKFHYLILKFSVYFHQCIHVHSLKHSNSFTRHIKKSEILIPISHFFHLFLLQLIPHLLMSSFCYFLILTVLGCVSTQSHLSCPNVIIKNICFCSQWCFIFLRLYLLNSTRKIII